MHGLGEKNFPQTLNYIQIINLKHLRRHQTSIYYHWKESYHLQNTIQLFKLHVALPCTRSFIFADIHDDTGSSTSSKFNNKTCPKWQQQELQLVATKTKITLAAQIQMTQLWQVEHATLVFWYWRYRYTAIICTGIHTSMLGCLIVSLPVSQVVSHKSSLYGYWTSSWLWNY
jgi:hypothetical protein